ncbi:hypothetical protein [uncultured Ruthenibacterium sp.]|uniref:hypothetical protein n=1 Tax=uncultured Ruthenibacterium sp. TaxID=1905347 RepID=UPI00349E4D96
MRRPMTMIGSIALATGLLFSGAPQSQSVCVNQGIDALHKEIQIAAETWIPEKPWRYEIQIGEDEARGIARWEEHTFYAIWEERNGWELVYAAKYTQK